MFLLYQNKTVVWYRPGEKKQPLEKPNPIARVMVWGGICRKNKTELYFFDSKVNAENYLKCLDIAVERTNQIFGHNKWTLMQDWAPAHKAKIVQEYLLNNVNKVLDHPSRSPDLNPIERVWAWMKYYVRGAKPTNKHDLIIAIYEAWNHLTVKKINKYIDCHCNMVGKVYEAKGNFIL